MANERFRHNVETYIGAWDKIFPFSENWPANYNFSLFSKLPTNYSKNQKCSKNNIVFPKYVIVSFISTWLRRRRAGRSAGRSAGRRAGRSSTAPVSSAAPKKKAFDRGGPVWPPRSNAKYDYLGGSLGGAKPPQPKTGGSGGLCPPPAKICFFFEKFRKTF